jgi:biopolymer transport protein ExbD
VEIVACRILLEINKMADIQSPGSAKKQKSFYKSKKLSTRVDLTPMVDLGFLLITFFIFTTSTARPTSMKLIMPDDTSGVQMPASEDKTLTVILGREDRLFYYPGLFKGEALETDYDGLRNIIRDKKQQILKRFGTNELLVLIKVSDEAKFKNIVDSLDEMIINTVSTYMLVEPEAKELETIKY